MSEAGAVASATIAYLHYLAMIGIGVLLVLEHTFCVPGVSAGRIRLLARLDVLYMAAAVVVLGSGVARVFWYGKGAAFYLHNPVFYLKLALFAAVGLMAIPPTLQYRRWLHSLDSAAMPHAPDYQLFRIRRYIVAQLVLFALIPLAAALMARGIGLHTVQ
ncbi:MAG: DUF2214 family protein [Betaproteobacteria bacterium]